MKAIKANILNVPKLQVNIHSEKNIKAKIGNLIITSGTEAKYKGKYKIVPKAYDEIVLQTKNKLMEENVIIEKVPYYETSNEFGNTVYIGAEMEIE